MSDEIVIKSDGSFYISDVLGDVKKANPAQIIEQKLYMAFMDMDPKIVTSRKFTTYGDIKTAMNEYLYGYFSSDSDVNPSQITVDVTETPGNDGVKLTVSYNGSTVDGEPVSVSTGIGYSLSSGALTSVDYLPSWLETPSGSGTMDIEHIVTLTSPQSEFEVPMEPFYSDDDPLGSLIRALLPGQTGSETEEMTFSIDLYSGRTKYPVSSFLGSSIRRNKVIYDVTVTSSDVDYNIIREYGEYIIAIKTDTESGNISGTVKVIPAVAATTTSVIRCSKVNNYIFELRRNRGKYYIIFPKTLQVGSYVIKYKALTGE